MIATAASRSRTAAGMSMFRRLSSSIIVCLVFVALTIEATRSGSTVQEVDSDFEEAAKEAAAEQLGSTILEDTIDDAFTFSSSNSSCYTGNGDEVTEACNGNCCMGENACSFTRATVCERSCDGKESCAGLGKDAVILPDSCDGLRACFENNAFVLFQSCKGNRSCRGNTGFVSNLSCLGRQACMNNAGVLDRLVCAAKNTCENNQGDIAAGSCTAKSSCKDNIGNIGNFTFTMNVRDFKGDVSCTSVRSCQGNSGDVGVFSCRGTEACLDNSGDIGNGACFEDGSCRGNTEDVDGFEFD